MPLPKTSDIGSIMRELKTGKKRPRRQMVAIALSQARKYGADIPSSAKQPKESKKAY